MKSDVEKIKQRLEVLQDRITFQDQIYADYIYFKKILNDKVASYSAARQANADFCT